MTDTPPSSPSPQHLPFVFFDLGQTLIDEWDYIAYFEQKFLELLNGFGERIDQRNYQAVRNSIIRDRKIGHGSVKELVIEVCRMLSPPGYERVIVNKLEPHIKQGRRDLFKFFKDAEPTLRTISKYCEMGIIANQSEDVADLIQESGFGKLFKVQTISFSVKLKKPDLNIFELALKQAGRNAEDCIMIGDRLDTDICPANKLGMTTIRSTNSLFALQVPFRACEHPDYTVTCLSEIPEILESIIMS
ncbi:MAG: HAD family hydrolase [Thermoproteota archaeon]|nr:HAD family hydrolase [Thermoproteota archaeon]